MNLSHDERVLLLSVVVSEHGRNWDRLATMLGTTIDMYELHKSSSEGDGGAPSRYLSMPLLMALAPELFTQVFEDYKNKLRSFESGSSGDGSQRVEIGTLSTEDAKNLLLGLNLNSGE